MLGGYTLLDIAHKVVGVGSVGLRAYVALLEGSSPDDVLFLQLKQARRSVLAKYVHGDSAWHGHQGQRVVEYQQALQTVSDPLLGWTTVGERQYYVRQFRNMKGTIPLDAIDSAALADYAGIVGHLLAKGHARTSGASMIAGYAGGSDKLDRAMARFARAYADQTEVDHARAGPGGPTGSGAGGRRRPGRVRLRLPTLTVGHCRPCSRAAPGMSPERLRLTCGGRNPRRPRTLSLVERETTRAGPAARSVRATGAPSIRTIPA